MAQTQALAISGNSIAVTPNAVSATVVLPLSSGVCPQLRLFNNTTQVVFIAFLTAANGTAVIPTAGVNANAWPVGIGEDMTVTIPPNCTYIGYLQASAGTGNLYISQGEGQ